MYPITHEAFDPEGTKARRFAAQAVCDQRAGTLWGLNGLRVHQAVRLIHDAGWWAFQPPHMNETRAGGNLNSPECVWVRCAVEAGVVSSAQR